VRLAARPSAVVGFGLSFAMALSGALAWFLDLVSPPTRAAGESMGEAAMFISAGISLAVSTAAFFFSRPYDEKTFRRLEATLAVAMVWGGSSLFGGLPFIIGAGFSPADAIFETASGFTTTGATIVANIEGTLSRALLLWRSLIQWLGGMGIVVLFVAVIPNLGAGGKQLFKNEVPGTTSEGLRPRIAETSFALWKLYAAFTLLEGLLLFGLGMTPFEAICHSLTTMATGGFSTRDASIAGFQSPAIEFTVSVFMVLAGVNYALYYGALRGRSLRVFFRSYEFKVYLALVLVSTLFLAVITLDLHGGKPLDSLRYGFFMVATVISSTGYAAEDFALYPPTGITIILFLMLVGGSAGSTAGGLKVERITLLAKLAWAQLHRSFRPTLVQTVRMGRSVISHQVLNDVSALFVVYVACLALGTLFVVGVDGVPVPTAFGAMLTSLSNIGPAPFYQEVDNFVRYSDPSKLLFAFSMVLGRLEFFTLLALFVPEFWRR
jgi:trk system potassium uptake protein TrkH